MKISRNPNIYMRRHGMMLTSPSPRPRLAPGDLLVHSQPIDNAALDANLLTGLAGEPPPDRGLTRPWPPGTAG